MNKKFIFSKVFFLMLMLFCSVVKAQLTCTPATFTDVTVMNTAGGTNSTNGLRIQLSGAGNIQIYRGGSRQIFLNDISSGSANNVPGTINGIVWSIGTTQFKTGTLFGGATDSSTALTPTSSTCTNTGNDFQHSITFSRTVSSLVYGLKVTYDYTSPNNYLTITYEVAIPAGGQQVRVSQAWDTLLAGGDTGPGFVTGVAPNYTMGTQKTVSGSVVYEAFKYKSGTVWSGYYSALYGSILGGGAMCTDLGSDNTFNNTIDTSSFTDNGIGISMNFGSTAGTFSSASDVIFLCNAPATAPTFSSTSYTAPCGGSANLMSNYTGTAVGSLPSGVSLRFLDSSGSIVSTPTAVSAAGTYYAFYVDANNADCSSPSTALTVTQGSCCSATPTVNNSSTLTNVCPATSVDLTTRYTGSSSFPAGTSVEWHTASSSPSAANLVATPTAVTTSGTYYAFFRNTVGNCYSPASAGVVVSIVNCCNAGSTAPVIN